MADRNKRHAAATSTQNDMDLELEPVEPRLIRSNFWNACVIASGPAIAILVGWSLPSGFLDPSGELHEVTNSLRVTIGALCWMALWWLTQCVPLWLTSLIPLFVFLPIGVVPIERLVSSYFDPTIRLFFGGFVLSNAIAKWGLGRRFSLAILKRLGTRPPNIIAGMMIVTAVVSAFVSNAATATIMFPIALSIVELVRRERAASPAVFRDRFSTCAMLGVAYAASLGGMMTIVGTPPNGILVSYLRDYSNVEQQVEISFLTWLPIGIPIALILLVVCWWILTQWLFRLPNDEIRGARDEVSQQLEGLGKIRGGELATIIIFSAAIAAWLFMPLLKLIEIPVDGSSSIKPFVKVQDWMVAVTAAAALLVWPISLKPIRAALSPIAALRISWSVLLLFGGGLALAAAIGESDADVFLASKVDAIESWPRALTITLIIISVVFFSEVASNTATVTTLLPIVAAVSVAWEIHPARLAIPVTLAASCGFMMPVATPPNAIMYSSRLVRAIDMIRAGWWLNWVGIASISLLSGWLVELVLF